jgi:hypothetical protein
VRGAAAARAGHLESRHASPAEARDYAATRSLQPEERVAKQVDSQLRSTSPPYQHTYWQGRELVEAHVVADPKRFRALLTARLLPSRL